MNLNRWKTKIFAAAAVLTAAVLVLTGSISFPAAAPLEVSAASGVSTSLTDAQLQAYADQVAAIVNQEREKVGKKPLYVLPRLNGAASHFPMPICPPIRKKLPQPHKSQRQLLPQPPQKPPFLQQQPKRKNQQKPGTGFTSAI